MQETIHAIIAELLPVLTAILTALAAYGVTLLAKRFKIQLSDEHQAVIRLAVRKAIGGAEEWAARKAGVKTDAVDGAEKAQWVHARVKALFPTLSPDELDRLIDEELATIKGAGATRDKVIEA
jgi:hypothetical protein